MKIDNSLNTLVADAQRRFSDRNPKSHQQLAYAKNYMPGGNTRTVLFYPPFPLSMARGDGCRLWDLDGHCYVDFLGEFTAGVYGHSHPLILDATVEAMRNGINLTAHNTLEAELARAVCERFPSIELVRFTNSGSEANLMAVGLARTFTGRKKVMVFDGGYHGGFLSFVKATNDLNAPYDFIRGSFNDIDGADKLIRENASDLAVILIEPMLGSGGAIPATKPFLNFLRSRTREIGALLIFDEVMTSRLGPSGLQEQIGIRPDITTLGKYLGGGSSIGAFGGRADVMSLFDPSGPNPLQHAGTFNNNVISMAAGLVGLTRVFTQNEAVELTNKGEQLRDRLNDVCRAHRASFQFTGIGSLMNAHPTDAPLSCPMKASEYSEGVRSLFFYHLIEKGFYIARRGFIVLSIPLGQTEIDGFVEAVEDFFLTYREALVASAVN